MKNAMKTVVIFRTYRRDGDTIALFPELPADLSPHHCLSYQSVGQHGAASCYLDPDTRPATRAEAAKLAAELRRIGYRLAPRTRLSKGMDRKRLAALELSR